MTVLSSNEVNPLRYSTFVDFLVSTFYKVDFYTLLSTCNEVTFRLITVVNFATD